jgi:thiol-disulfide isomerase/thioredoxin
MRRLRVLAVAALAAVAGLAGCGSGPTTPTAQTFTIFPAADRQLAPRVTGELLDGGQFDLAQHAGEVVVINFWGSWCGPCVVEAPDFEATYQATKAQKVFFLGVDTRDSHDAAVNFVKGRTTYPSIFDTPGRVALSFKVPPASIPSTVIIDRQGRVAASIYGYALRSSLQPVVEQLAAESG